MFCFFLTAIVILCINISPNTCLSFQSSCSHQYLMFQYSQYLYYHFLGLFTGVTHATCMQIPASPLEIVYRKWTQVWSSPSELQSFPLIADGLKTDRPLLLDPCPPPCLSLPPSFSLTFFPSPIFLPASLLHSVSWFFHYLFLTHLLNLPHLCMQPPYNTDIVRLTPYTKCTCQKNVSCN